MLYFQLEVQLTGAILCDFSISLQFCWKIPHCWSSA